MNINDTENYEHLTQEDYELIKNEKYKDVRLPGRLLIFLFFIKLLILLVIGECILCG